MNGTPARSKEIILMLLLLAALVLFQTRPLYRVITHSVIHIEDIYLKAKTPVEMRQWSNLSQWDTDIGIAVWAHHWFIHALRNKPLGLFDANIYHPYPNSMAFMDCYLGQAMIGLPAARMFDLPAMTYNWILIWHILLTGLSMFLYVRYKTGSVPAGCISGAAAVLLPYHYARIATIHKSAFYSLPLSLFLIDRYLETRRLRYAAGLAAVLSFQIISTWYMTVILFFFIGLYALHLLLFRKQLLLRRDTLKGVLVILLIVVPVALSTLSPYLEQNRMFPQFERTLDVRLTVPLKMYLTIPQQNRLYGKVLTDTSVKWNTKTGFFPGFTLYILALGGMAVMVCSRKIRKKDHTATGIFMLWILVPAVILSLGPFFRTATGQWKLPYYYLVQIIPLMKGLRGPQDFVLIFYTAILFFTGTTAAVLFSGKTRIRHAAVAAGIILLIAVETQNKPFSTMILPNRNQVAECYSHAIPGVKAVATFYPYRCEQGTVRYGIDRIHAMYCSIFHMHPIPEGHTAYIPPLGNLYERENASFPDRDSFDFLKCLGISHVLIDCRHYGSVTPDDVASDLAHHPDLRITDHLKDSLVIRLYPPVKPLLHPVAAFFRTPDGHIRLGMYNPGRTILHMYQKDREIHLVDRNVQTEKLETHINLPQVFRSGNLLEFALPDDFQKHIFQNGPASIDLQSVKPVDLHTDLLTPDQWHEMRVWVDNIGA